ncbi:preprotein translocase subunit SecG [Stenotrophomonas sp.]|uniref:preprotein translocase subunit SecG n=1 Tax=Stenotrophomonas sp. TaxID=69392 RepID=UPI0028A84AFB|nr:preprotein translocase subunit SecG [Stenotrophomonas sp.]
MLMLILNVVYVLVAIAMIALILMQRGSGAAAGSGFGAGASGTVFGARGASNFLSKSTKWLAVVFFGISLFMAWYATHGARPTNQGLGVMSQVEAPAAAPAAAPAGELQPLPAAPAASAVGEVPQAAAPAENIPVQSEEKPAEGSQKD